MEEKDHIKELFQQQLSGLETPVRPEIWTAVSSSIGATSAAAATTGISLLAKITIGAITAASVTGLTWFAFQEKDAPKAPLKEKKEQQTAQKTSSQQVSKNTSDSEPTASTIYTLPVVKPVAPEPITSELNAEIAATNMFSLPMSYATIKSEATNESATSVNTSKTKDNTAPKSEVKEVVDEVKEAKMPEKSTIVLELPNVFTPNGDGNNDFLQIQAKEVNDFSLVVLDAFGKTVFKTQDPDFKWDGKGFNDELLPVGNYVYFVTGTDEKGKQVSKYSTLTIKY